jgi:hypothetical protein
MRGFLIFLAFACPVVLLSPFFWSLVRMEFGAERVGYVQHNGVTQWATLGPQAPWPRWAVVPKGARLTVRSNFEAAPGHIATGLADLQANDTPQAIGRRYQEALHAAAWTVTSWRFDTTSADIPPHPIHTCIIEGRRSGRVQRLFVEMADAAAAGSIYWADGPLPPLIGARAEGCWRV